MTLGAVDPVVATATPVAIGVVALVARLMRRAARTHRMRIAIVWGAVVLGAGVAVGGYLVNRVLVVTTSRG